MNKNCYKTIYNRNLGRIVVVSERARNVGKTHSQGNSGAWHRLLPLSWRVALILGSLCILPAGAEIIADSNAVREHQPQVLLSSEGVPQVDIQAPTAAGVSMNEYTRFDVGGEGAILNNSRKGAPTHIGGWVSGNPNLIKNDASVIVNQVNSSDPSRLHGTIEVAGKRADVIIANPAGISVNGGGFINADKAWLTSGKPEMQDGAFRGVNVEQGRITVGADGLDVRDSNYAAIIAKAAKIDGPVRAGDKKLDVITGANRVDSDGNVQKTGGDSAAPVAIDTGHLGGMYGGSIRLISSDRGVGVNHAGVVQAQQLHISADGKLENRGSIQSDNLQVDAQALANHGKISQGNGTLNITADNVDNQGGIYRNRVAAQDAVQDSKTPEKAKAASNKKTDGHIRLKGTLANNGQITSGGEVNLSAARDLNNSGDIDAGTLRVAEGSHKNTGNIRTQNATLSGRHLDNQGSISATDTLTVHTQTLENDGSLRASALDLAGDSLYNRGEISGTGSGEMQITTASWSNLGYVGRGGGEGSGAATDAKTGGTTGKNGGGTGSSRLNYARINNEGSISQAGGVSLDVKGDFANHGSMTLNSLTYRGETLDNRDGRLQTQKADISAHTLDNENGLFAAEHISRLELTGKLNNKNGTFYSGDDLRFTVPHFENPEGSSFGSGKTLSVKSDILNNDGRLFAANVLELQAQQLNNRGSLQGGALAIDADTLTNSGQIEQTGRGTLTVRADNLDNRQDGIIGKSPADGKNSGSAGQSGGATSATAADGHISVGGTLTNSGRISAAGKLRLEGGSKIHNAGHIQVEELASRNTLLDNHGHLQADNAWLSGDALTNYGALIAGTYHEFRYDRSVTNHGSIYGQHNYRIDSPQITNHQEAHIVGAAGLQLGGNVDNRGDIRAQRLSIDAGGNLTNSGNLIGTEQIQLSDIHTTNNSSGLIYGGRTDIDGGDLTNHGRIGAARELRFTLPQLTNHGQLFSAGLITGEVANLNNHELIRGQTVTLRGITLNNHGQIAADSSLTLNQQQLTNHGLLDAARFAISGQQLDNHGIIRQRGGTLAIKTEQLDNRGNIGLLPADNPATGSGNGTSPTPGNDAANSGAGGGSGSIELAGINNHNGAAILSAGQTDLSVNQQQLINHGKMQLGTFHYSGDALDNYGQIRARRGELSGKTLTNREGAVLSAGDFATFSFTDNIKNSGTLYSDSNFRLHSTHIENKGANSLIASNGVLDIHSEHVENRGRIQSGGSLQGNIGSLENSGLLGSGGNLQLDLQRLDNQGTGQLLARGRLSLAVSEAIQQHGRIEAGGALQLHTPLLANYGTIQSALTTLRIDGKLDNHGTISASGSQHITAESVANQGTLGAGSQQHIDSQSLDNAGLVTAASLHLKSDTLDNRGDIRQTGSAGFNIRVADLDNWQGATLGENRAADHPAPGGQTPATPATPPATSGGANGSITTTTLTNSGNIVAGGAVDLATTNRLNNDGTLRASRLLADGETMRSTGDIDATDAIIRSKDTDIGGRFSGQRLDLDIEHYTNRAILRFDHINWNKLKTLSNYGDIDSKVSLNFRMERLENGAGGSLRTAGTFDFNGEHIKNDGTLLSQGAQTITAKHIENGGLLASGAGQTLRAEKISHHAGGEIDATHIDWQADTINNDGAVFIGGDSALNITAPVITNHGIIGQTDVNLPNRAHQLSEAVAQAQQQNLQTPQSPSTPAPQNPPPALPASKVEAKEQLSIGSSQGGFISNGRVSVTTPALANHGKMRLAELDVAGTDSEPGSFTNSGQIDADTARIMTPDIHNSGTLASADLTLETERLHNSGTLAGEHSYAVNAKESIKNSGNILSGETLTLNSPYLESTGGRISAVDLILNLPDYLRNGGKIIARHLTLNTPNLDNSGHIYGEADYQVKVDTLANSGILSSPGKLTVTALHDRLAIANDGQILAGQTELTADSLHGSGTVSGADTATVRVGSVSGSQSITAGRHLQLDVAGDLSTDSGTIGAGGVADIRAANIHNGGKLLAGQELNLTTNTLNNTGLINTSGATRIRVNHLANHGRLYGDWVDLITPYLKNHDGAVIAARQHLEVDGGTIDNRLGSANGAAPLIKSDGSMRLKGQSLDNGGGTIQSAGDMELRGLHVKNDNPYFQTYTKVEEQKGQKFMRSLDPDAPNSDLHERSKFKEGQRKYIAHDPSAVGGIKEINRTQEITADVRTETTEVAHSTPGRILAGGNLIVNATSITNDKGQVIAGGAITYLNGGNTDNLDAERTTQTFYDGTYKNTVDTKRGWKGWKGHKRIIYDEGKYHDSTPPKTDKMDIVKTAAHSDPGLIAHDNSADSDVAASSGPVERIESGGYVTTGVNQLLPDGQLFQSADNERDPLLRTDPDYIGGVTADIPAYRKPGAPQGGAQPPVVTQADHSTPQPRARNGKEALALVEANLADRLKARLNRIEGRLADINPQDAPQSGVSFGVDQNKIAALEPWLPPGLDPHDLHKPIGDLYANLELVRRQLALQTGRLQLPGEGDEIERYKALLASGEQVRSRFGLKPGVALSGEQMAALTGDVLLMVNTRVRGADGRWHDVSVPQLYSKKRQGDVDGRRTLISGEHIEGRAEKLDNRAIFNARQSNTLHVAKADNRGGTLSARDLLLESDSAIDNTGGEIRARRILHLKSGGDIINDSTTSSASGSSANSAYRKETIDRRGRIILDGEGGEEDNSQGYLSLYAGENIESRTGDIKNHNSGSQSYLSGKNVHFDVRTLDNRFTLNSGGQSRLGAPGRDYLSTRVATDHGSHIEGKGDIFIHAREGKVHGLGMQINSADGSVAIYGRDGVDLKNGWEERDLISSQYHKGYRFIGRKENETYREEHSKSAIPGLISGKRVAIVAGYDPENHAKQNGHADVNLTGIYAVSDNGTLLKAGHNVTVSAAEETYRTDYRDYQRKSGLFYKLQNPLALEIAHKEWENSNKGHGKHYAPSLVGALDGNVVIEADNHYQNNGSIIHASRQENLGPVASKAELAAMTDAERDAYWDKRMKAGNVIIRAKSAAETALVADHHNEQENRFQSRGLKIGLIGGVADNINATASNLYTLSHSDNSRVKAMAAGLAAYNLQQSMTQFQQGGQGGAGGGGNTKIAITYGVSKSKSASKSDWQSVQAAQTTADGTVYMQVRGGGENSTYTNTGSDIGGGERTLFDVEGKKTFQSVLTNQHLRNDNRSWEAHGGIAFDRNTIGVNAGGNIAGGYYEGTEGLHRLSRVGTLTGHTDLGEGKTTLHGAQAFGRSIWARTEDLTVISPQGTGRERGMQYSLGADATVGYGFVSGSVDANYSRLQGDYQTVNAESGARDAADGLSGRDARSQDLADNIHASDAAYNARHAHLSGQSGFYAGTDGFDIENKGEARLLGGIITSDKSAEQNGYNRFVTDTLRLENVENHSSSKGFAIAANAGYSKEQDKNTGAWQPGSLSSSRGATLHHDNQRGTTYAAIGTTNITIRDAAQQQAKTGHSVADTIAQAQRDIWTDSAPGASGATRSHLTGQDKLHDMAEEAGIKREVDQTRQQILQEKDKELERLQAQREAGTISENEYQRRANDIHSSKRLIDGGLRAITAPGGVPGAAMGFAQPYAAQWLKENTTPGSFAHVGGHFTLGALNALANGGNGGDALLSGTAAGAAEIAIPQLAQRLYGTSDPNKLTAEQKRTVLSLANLGGFVVGGAGGNPVNAVNASSAAENAIENNYYLTYTALKPKNDIQNSKETYEILKQTVTDRCDRGSRGECAQYIQYIVDFINDERFSKDYATQQQESLEFLKNHPELVKGYVLHKQYQFELEDNSKLHKYVLPTAEMVAGGLQAAGSATLMGTTCAETIGWSCALASASLVSGSDHFTTGWSNWGVRRSQQRQTDMVESLKATGLSESNAQAVQLALDMGTSGLSYAKNLPVPNTVKTSPPLKSYRDIGLKIDTLDNMPPHLANPAEVRSQIQEYVKRSDFDKISIATATVEINGKTERFIAVSGKSWKGDSPRSITLNDGKTYKVITEDSGSVAPVKINSNGQLNKNHAEQKLFSYFQDNFAGQSAKIEIAVQNNSIKKAGMCAGCQTSSRSFSQNNREFNITIYQGTTGTSP